VAQCAYDQAEGRLREMGISEHVAHYMVSRAVDRVDAEDATGRPHNHSEGSVVAGWPSPDIDAQLEGAQHEFAREFTTLIEPIV
jgi:hypothetical protein